MKVGTIGKSKIQNRFFFFGFQIVYYSNSFCKYFVKLQMHVLLFTIYIAQGGPHFRFRFKILVLKISWKHI